MDKSNSKSFRVGADIGGTFTDLVMASADGRIWTRKVLSTPDDYSRAIVSGVRDMLADSGALPDEVSEVIHGTTVATNAILEGKGAKTALITTRGFRDVLELRRLRVPELYSLFYEPPKPLVERRLRLEVTERVGPKGEVITRLDEESVVSAIERIAADGAESVAVCLLHSYVNPAHERRIGKLVNERLPARFLSLSVEVLPEIREYERTSTTVVNAYVGPLVKRYIDALAAGLKSTGVGGHLRIMQSNGGVMSARAASQRPAHIVESGPAAGVVGALKAAAGQELRNIITFDMGGTTAKASLIEGGRRSWTTEYEVGAGIQLSSKLVKGRGHAVKLPVLDIAEVGAGGGSIVWIDRGGAMKVGPQSAGASPGPACYGAGGTEPTVTDANVVLGYVSPSTLAGGAVKIDAELARNALTEKVSSPLGISLNEAAHGVHTVANTNMVRALKAVTTYRGRDPREFALFAFGGNGPVHACTLAQALGIRRVIVPPSPGLFSAVGMLVAEPEQHFVQTYFAPLKETGPTQIEGVFSGLRDRALNELSSEGYSEDAIRWTRQADLRYQGQAFEITVDIPSVEMSAVPDALSGRFHEEHLRTYGHNAPGIPVELVNLRIVGHISSDASISSAPRMAGRGKRRTRDAYFGEQHGIIKTPVLARADLTTRARQGPLIIEEYDATTVVPPGCRAGVDKHWNLVVEIDA